MDAIWYLNNPGDLVDIVTNKLSEELIFDLKLYGSGDKKIILQERSSILNYENFFGLY